MRGGRGILCVAMKKNEEKRRRYLYGEAVCHHHDDQWDEEGHEGANQHEALLVEDTAAIDEDLVLVAEADHWDRHRHTLMVAERQGV